MSEKAASMQVTYDDLSSRRFLWATMIWGIVGMAVGDLGNSYVYGTPVGGLIAERLVNLPERSRALPRRTRAQDHDCAGRPPRQIPRARRS